MSVGHPHRRPNRLSHLRELPVLLRSGGAPSLMQRRGWSIRPIVCRCAAGRFSTRRARRLPDATLANPLRYYLSLCQFASNAGLRLISGCKTEFPSGNY
jgi:hypothetical protein